MEKKERDYSTLMITLHPRAPASRIAHPRHPLFLLLMIAFHPFWAHSARTRISMSEPNCLLRHSRCILLGKLPLRSIVGEKVNEDPPVSPRCSTGDTGISA